MPRKQTIKLINKRGEVSPFGMPHALNLLRMQKAHGNKDWAIDKSEKDWKFGNNEIYRDTNSGSQKESEASE